MYVLEIAVFSFPQNNKILIFCWFNYHLSLFFPVNFDGDMRTEK